MVLTILLLLLGINKQLDFQTLFNDVLRRMAKADGWYSVRRFYQVIFIATITALGLLSLGCFSWLGAQRVEAELPRPAGHGLSLRLRDDSRHVHSPRGHLAAMADLRREVELGPRAGGNCRDPGGCPDGAGATRLVVSRGRIWVG